MNKKEKTKEEILAARKLRRQTHNYLQYDEFLVSVNVLQRIIELKLSLDEILTDIINFIKLIKKENSNFELTIKIKYDEKEKNLIFSYKINHKNKEELANKKSKIKIRKINYPFVLNKVILNRISKEFLLYDTETNKLRIQTKNFLSLSLPKSTE